VNVMKTEYLLLDVEDSTRRNVKNSSAQVIKTVWLLLCIVVRITKVVPEDHGEII